MSTDKKRQPKGTKSGGQFAPDSNPESDVELSSDSTHAKSREESVSATSPGLAAGGVRRPTMDTHFDFGDGPVPAHRHVNGGGWVADTARVEDTVFVGSHAKVCDRAVVQLGARISGHSIVEGDSSVCENALVIDSVVRGSAIVRGESRVLDRSVIEGGAVISGFATVCNGSRVADEALVDGHALISDSTLTGMARADRLARVVRGSVISDRARVSDWATVEASTMCRETEVGDSAHVFDSRIEDFAVVRDYASVLNGCTLGGRSHVVGEASVSSGAHVRGYSLIRGDAVVRGGAHRDLNIDGGFLMDGKRS